MEHKTASLEFAGKTLTLQIGQLAPQATSSVLARLGDTMVLVTVVAGGTRPDIDYFPLSVEYVERLYAGGKIKGSRWVKREGRPSDEAILTGRLIDRSIRPLFPKEYKNDVQIVITVLSVDGENEPDILSLIAVSAALSLSNIPWNGPIGGIRIGLIKDQEGNYDYILNPTSSEQEFSELDIVVSQTRGKTHMIEAGALQAPEGMIEEAVRKAHDETEKVITFIENLVREMGQEKVKVTPNAALSQTVALIEKGYKAEIEALIKSRADKEAGGNLTHELAEAVLETEKKRDSSVELDKKILIQAIEYVMYKKIRKDVVEKQKRVDGRKIDEIRPISTLVGLLPRTHGSALFQRGLTQALSIVTLGSPRLEQLIESAEGEETKRYIHHYSGLPYSFGQTGRVGTPSRREIGHGALAERALLPVIPNKETFPYTIRVVSEVLSQNGSSSMASTCGSTLALMDAGVPVESPVAGISIGMMSDKDKYVLLTDIIGLEDFSGDMDFKVAGTKKGVTAIQLDVKIPGLTVEQIKEIFVQARTARVQILEKMLAIIPTSREAVSEYAPKIELIQIPVDKIGEIIGPGGRNIRAIIAQTGATVDIDDNGVVTVSGTSEEAVKHASDWIHGMIKEVAVGEVYTGPVKRILPFGAFVEYLPGKEGLVHVSKMKRGFVKDPNDVVTLEQEVTVKIDEVDSQGRINLSMLLDANSNDNEPEGQQPNESGQGPDKPRTDTRPYQRNDHPLAQQFRRENSRERDRSRGSKFSKKRYSR